MKLALLAIILLSGCANLRGYGGKVELGSVEHRDVRASTLIGAGVFFRFEVKGM